jgi:thiamine-monophosphate kinase
MTKTLADIGEFGLIDRIDMLIQNIGVPSPGITLGIGDDTASLSPRPGYELLLTCDCLIEKIHYLPEHIAPLDLGRRAMTVNISDIGAMGGQPSCALISLGLKSKTPVADVEDMYRGFVQELNPFNASIIGGNITKSEKAIFIDITLIGEVEKENILLRSTAQAGDVILVTGYPGQSAAGLKLLQNSRTDEDLNDHPLVQAYNVPSHRAREGHAVAQTRKAHAMIDTSDGFLADLGHICQASQVGALLSRAKFPISDELKKSADQLGMDPYQLFLSESDDYELIITCPPENVAKIKSTVVAVSQKPIHEVGEITDKAMEIVLKYPDGTKNLLNPNGWDHFKG